jgi:VWFA-related protein
MFVAAAAWLLPQTAAVGQTPAPQAQPTFRARTSLVPVDVRVLDRNGKPILDLKASDFTIKEDGTAQQIRHFSPIVHTPVAAAAAGRLPVRRLPSVETAPLSAPSRRLFLIVFGRGRLQHPSMGVDGVMRFVAERLLPQDQIAVMAYNRATDFTADRAGLGQVLERFKANHEAIEAKLRQHFSGWAAAYKNPDLPPEVQKDIDAIFRGAGTAVSRELPPGAIADSSRMASDDRGTTDDLQRAAILRERARALAAIGQSLSVFEQMELAEIDASGLQLDQYIAANRQTMQDLGRLYAGVDYLRHIDGEKHLVFVTEQGLFLPRVESELAFAAAANHARVAVDIIQTGGQVTQLKPAFKSGGLDPLMIIDVTTGEPLQQRFAVGSLRTMSELTGGQASVYDYADKALERIAVATSAGYLLGY